MTAHTESEGVMRKYGPLVFSHYFRALHDEQRAMWATRRAVETLMRLGLRTDRDVVRWIRRLRPATATLTLLHCPAGQPAGGVVTVER